MKGTQSLYSLMTAQGDQRDIDNFVRTLSLSTWVGMTYMTGLIHSATKNHTEAKEKEERSNTKNIHKKQSIGNRQHTR